MRYIRVVKVWIAVCAVLLLCAAPAAWAGPKAVARVNGADIIEMDVDQAMQEIMPSAIFHGGISAERKKQYRSEAIERAIEFELLAQLAAKKKYIAVGDVVDGIVASNVKKIGGKARFEAALKRAELAEKEFRERIGKRLIVEEMIRSEVTEKSEPMADEVKAFYEANKGKYMRPDTRHVLHIMIKVDPAASPEEREKLYARAEEARAKIVNGTPFGDVAWDYSDDQYRVKGGDLGMLHKGRMDPSIENQIWALPKGELSGVMESIFGYHIARVEEIADAKQMTLDEVFGKISKELSEANAKRLREALMAEAKAGASIEVLEK